MLSHVMDCIVCSRLPWPLVLALLLLHFCANCTLPVQDLQFLESFAGHAEVSASLRALGVRGHTHDISYHTAMDILSSAGFMSAAQTLVLTVWLCYTPKTPLGSGFPCTRCFEFKLVVCGLPALSAVRGFGFAEAPVSTSILCFMYAINCRFAEVGEPSPILLVLMMCLGYYQPTS